MPTPDTARAWEQAARHIEDMAKLREMAAGDARVTDTWEMDKKLKEAAVLREAAASLRAALH